MSALRPKMWLAMRHVLLHLAVRDVFIHTLYCLMCLMLTCDLFLVGGDEPQVDAVT